MVTSFSNLREYHELGSGEGDSNPLQYSCPGNPMDRGAWWTVQSTRGLQKTQTQLSD